MKTRTKVPLPTALAKGRRRFDEFRRRHRPRAPVSKELWSLAVDLAREHGLKRTARALGLDYYSLKKRVDAAGDPGNKPEFIELLPAGFPPGPECTIELEDAAGAKMRIHLKGADLPDLADMARVFRRGEA
jgi:hypothetical protein